MKNKNEIEILIGIVEQYRGENFYDKIHTIVAEHPILSRFESYTSFDEVLSNLYYELYKTEQDEEKEKIQMAIDAVKTIYDQYEDELESAISTNKMDARISDKFNDNSDPTVFYRFLSEELRGGMRTKSWTPLLILTKSEPVLYRAQSS